MDLEPHDAIRISARRARERCHFPELLEIAVLAGSFSRELVGDPADRIIVATALHHRLPLVTKDEQIQRAGVVKTIW